MTALDLDAARRRREASERRIAAGDVPPLATTPTPPPEWSDPAASEAIKVRQGELHTLVATAHELLAERSSGLYRFGGNLAHVVRLDRTLTFKDGRTIPEGTLETTPACREWLTMELCRIATWQRPVAFDAEGAPKKWAKCDPPAKIAATVLKDPAGWASPVLNGTSEVPVMRLNGSVCVQPGYDRETAIFYDPGQVAFPALPREPARKDALAALDLLKTPLRDFPFAEPAHRSAALAMILTAVVRRQLGRSVAFGIDAREAGTRKTLLATIACVIATGREPPTTPFSDDEPGAAQVDHQLPARRASRNHDRQHQQADQLRRAVRSAHRRDLG